MDYICNFLPLWNRMACHHQKGPPDICLYIYACTIHLEHNILLSSIIIVTGEECVSHLHENLDNDVMPKPFSDTLSTVKKWARKMSCHFGSIALYTCPTFLPTWAMSLTKGPGGEILPCRERFLEWILGYLWTPVLFDLRKGSGGCGDGRSPWVASQDQIRRQLLSLETPEELEKRVLVERRLLGRECKWLNGRGVSIWWRLYI